jgi:prepilin-type N-terminal cleavage/methylation domain-containing protein
MRKAFTLVELLVVITIIGLLVGMLAPAVMHAIEQARITQCANKLRQFVMGSIAHNAAHSYYPSGGWNGNWSGDPNYGTGQGQPGGWTYTLLPFIEGQPTHDLGIGLAYPANSAALSQAAQVLNSSFYCPTRRAVALYHINATTCNTSGFTTAMHTDYAANAGTNQSTNLLWTSSNGAPTGGNPAVVGGSGYQFPVMNASDGVIYTLSTVSNADVARNNGAANMIMFGEKYMDPMHYTDGGDPGDVTQLYAGFSQDCQRWGGTQSGSGTSFIINPNSASPTSVFPMPPQQDKRNSSNPTSFGSAHANGLNIVTCDGSGHFMNYGISPQIFAEMSSLLNSNPVGANP